MAQQAIAPPPTIPLVFSIETRDGTLNKDAKMVNAYAEMRGKEPSAVKRPGTTAISLIEGTPQGQFILSSVPFAIVSDSAIDLNTQTATIIPSVTVPFQQYDHLDDVPVGTSLIKSPSGLWSYDGITFTKVTDANYPATTVPGIVYIDGVYYVMNPAGEVLGSGIEDPTTWPPLDFIRAELTLGPGVGIVRHLNYLSAYYERGLQLYYDADAAPNGQGTALGPVTNASWTTGCASGRTIVEISDITFWVAQDTSFGKTVQTLQGLQMVQVSDPHVDKILSASTLVGSFAFGMRVAGHTFYILTLPDLNLTLVYDQTSGMWNQWTSIVNGVEGSFAGTNYVASIQGDYVQDLSTGRTLIVQNTLYSDDSGPINFELVTPPFDTGNLNRKRFPSQFLIADTISATVFLSYSDDDYATWSTPRAITLSTVRKMLQRCGMSRRRAWKFTCTDPQPLRLYKMMIDLIIGSA